MEFQIRLRVRSLWLPMTYYALRQNATAGTGRHNTAFPSLCSPAKILSATSGGNGCSPSNVFFLAVSQLQYSEQRGFSLLVR